MKISYLLIKVIGPSQKFSLDVKNKILWPIQWISGILPELIALRTVHKKRTKTVKRKDVV